MFKRWMYLNVQFRLLFRLLFILCVPITFHIVVVAEEMILVSSDPTICICCTSLPVSIEVSIAEGGRFSQKRFSCYNTFEWMWRVYKFNLDHIKWRDFQSVNCCVCVCVCCGYYQTVSRKRYSRPQKLIKYFVSFHQANEFKFFIIFCFFFFFRFRIIFDGWNLIRSM